MNTHEFRMQWKRQLMKKRKKEKGKKNDVNFTIKLSSPRSPFTRPSETRFPPKFALCVINPTECVRKSLRPPVGLPTPRLHERYHEMEPSTMINAKRAKKSQHQWTTDRKMVSSGSVRCYDELKLHCSANNEIWGSFGLGNKEIQLLETFGWQSFKNWSSELLVLCEWRTFRRIRIPMTCSKHMLSVFSKFEVAVNTLRVGAR